MIELVTNRLYVETIEIIDKEEPISKEKLMDKVCDDKFDKIEYVHIRFPKMVDMRILEVDEEQEIVTTGYSITEAKDTIRKYNNL